MVVSQANLQRVHIFEHALVKAGATACYVLSDSGSTPQPLEAVLRLAALRGIAVLPPPAGAEMEHETALLVSAAGQPIPGGDKLRRTLVEPIIREGYLVWIYAKPKIGKTWLALTIAHAAASANGRVGPWVSPETIGVLHVDGEMRPDELQDSIDKVMVGAGDAAGAPSFDVLCAQRLEDCDIDLTDERWQQQVEQHLSGKQLLILDNFQALTGNGPTALKQLQPWVRRLMRMGIAVIVVDHTNREGDLQGSIAKERIADLSIALRYASEADKKEGMVTVEFPVARRLHGMDAEPFRMQKVFTDHSFTFRLLDVEPPAEPDLPSDVLDRLRRMAQVVVAKDDEEMSYKQIEDRYDIPASTAHGDYKAAQSLSEAERAVFEAECARLRSERST